SDHIKGEEGTDVTITVYRDTADEYLDLPMVRAVVQNPTVEFEMLDDQVGYISLSSFEEVSVEQFKKAVDALEADGMKGLVLDLRNNGGGLVSAAESIADYMLPEGDVVVSFKGKGLPESVYVTSDEHQVDVPIVVLVNEESASASEVLTGALKDNDYATVVGTTTFGKGIAQGLFPMPDGSALKLTTAYYYFPSGECIHEIGIKPDVEVELEEELKSLVEIPKEDDNQLQRAVEVLVQKVNK
ncbi:MAG: S41 family peptidase, partial [Lachnospiraceae bacterium]|nr:S41 family peptidase [Lachnospiraceae bacterium]